MPRTPRPIPLFAVLAALGAIALPATAEAASTATAAMPVSVEVLASCGVAAEPLAFGGATAAAGIEVACAPGVAFSVALDDGQNGTRIARDPVTGATLAYDIFVDAGRSRRWGGGGAETVAETTPSSGIARLIAYGGIVDAGSAAAGSYADTVTVTIAF